MTTPARFCLRLGTLLLALMVTVLWAGPRAHSSTSQTLDTSDPTMQLALGVLQADVPAPRSQTTARLELEHQPTAEAPVMPALSDLVLPDEIVPVVAPAKFVAQGPVCEDV